jgi:hypothetical protein
MKGDSAVVTPSRSRHRELNNGPTTTDNGRRPAWSGEFPHAIENLRSACNGKSRPETSVSSSQTPGGEEARDSAPQRRQRRKISQLIALKRLASTAQNAVQRRGCAVLRRVCAVTVFQRAGCIGCRDRSDQATRRLRITFWKLFFSVQSD